MFFKQDESIEELGESVGYVLGYFLFTTVLFFVLSFLNKLPRSWSFFHMMAVTVLISFIGVVAKRFLK